MYEILMWHVLTRQLESHTSNPVWAECSATLEIHLDLRCKPTCGFSSQLTQPCQSFANRPTVRALNSAMSSKQKLRLDIFCCCYCCCLPHSRAHRPSSPAARPATARPPSRRLSSSSDRTGTASAQTTTHTRSVDGSYLLCVERVTGSLPDV